MAIQGSRPRPSRSSSAGIANLPRPTSPDLQTDSDDDASTSSDSDEDVSSADVRNLPDIEEATARRDSDGKTHDDSRKPPPRNRDEDLVRAIQERVRVQSLLYDTPSTTTTAKQKSTGPPISRAHLRLALSTLRARQSLASRSFSHLSSALSEISKALLSLGGPHALAKTMLERRRPALETTTAPTSGKPNFGVFVPILARLVKDVRTTVSGEGVKGREFRRSELSREEAKALVALRQRWGVKPSGATGGKSTGKGGRRDQKDLEWVDMVEKLVAENPPPARLLPPSTANKDALEEEDRNKTSSLLTSIEQLVLPAALPRISLSALDLDDHDLAEWPALEGVEEIVRCYLSFGYKRQRGEDVAEEKVKAREVLDGVKVLDLSHNRLSDFPRHLVRLFPNLEALSLSHNRFTRLPPWITLFSSLRRLETDHNPLVPLVDLNGVRANSREMYKLVEDAVRRTVTQVSRAELLLSLRRQHHQTTSRRAGASLRPAAEAGVAPPRSLFSLSVELAQTHLLASSSHREINLDSFNGEGAAIDMMVPPHLLEVVTTSYRCISCDRFVVTTMPDDSAWFVPPFRERVHFLNPGIVVVVSSEGSRRRDRTRRRRRREEERGGADGDDDGDGEEGEVVEYLEVGSSSAASAGPVGKSATLEQRLLLAVLARQEQGSLAPRDQESRRSSGGGGGGGGHKNALSSRFFDSDYGRRHSRSTDHDNDGDAGAATLTFVVGGRGPHGVGFRFCALCAASHLGVRDAVLAKLERERDEGSEDGDGRDVVASWMCRCEMCEEERRVRGSEDMEEDNAAERRRVVRWLRRYDAVR